MIDNKLYHYYDTIDSTNNKAKELAQEGCANHTIVSAGTQTVGKGRSGHQWESEEGTTISTSMVLYPSVAIEHVSRLTLVAAVAVYRAVEEVISQTLGEKAMYGSNDDESEREHFTEEYRPSIKWPNDILLKNKKICGILTEMSAANNQINYVVVGIGVNVHNRTFPEELQHKATSIDLILDEMIQNMQTGQDNIHVGRTDLTMRIWEHFLTCYEQFGNCEDLSFCLEDYNAHLANVNRTVRVLDPLGEYTGTALGMDETGELLVAVDGEVRHVSSGEVSVRGLYGYV